MAKFIFAAGQSNMHGNGANGPWDMPSNLRIWNNENAILTLSELGTQTIAPTRGSTPFNEQFNNLAIQACAFYARQTTTQIRLVLSAKGGQPISAWHDGTNIGPMLTRNIAIYNATNRQPYSAFLWHQGESGITQAGWDGMISVMTAEGMIAPTTPIIMGTLAPKYATSNAMIQSIASNDPRITLVPVGGLPREADDTHLTGLSLVTAGLMYAAALRTAEL